jgi:hypothetical protein
MILDRRYYERKNMETKGAEDVLGGADSWKNVDKTEGRRRLHVLLYVTTGADILTVDSQMSARRLRMPYGLLQTSANSQCRRAFYELLQVCGVCYGVA